ncbi:MAG: hypothetical protein QNK64_11065 [Saprospiraceae bacterium]
MFGAMTGFVVGALIGSPSGDDSSASLYSLTAQEKIWYRGIALTVLNALIGGIVSAAKVKIPINGNQKNYKHQRDKLQKIMSFDQRLTN